MADQKLLTFDAFCSVRHRRKVKVS